MRCIHKRLQSVESAKCFSSPWILTLTRRREKVLHTELCSPPLTFHDNVAFLHERTLRMDGVSQKKKNSHIDLVAKNTTLISWTFECLCIYKFFLPMISTIYCTVTVFWCLNKLSCLLRHPPRGSFASTLNSKHP